MNCCRGFAAACAVAVSSIVGCSSVEHGEPNASAGDAGATLGGASSGGSSAGMGAAAGQVPAGGASGSASAGTGGGTGGSDGTTGGTAGMGLSAAGEAGAGPSGPMPLLENGSFETGGLFPWQAVVTPDVRGVYTQWPTSGMSIDGKNEVSFWNGTTAFTGDLHQLISGLTPGKYELKLYIAYGLGLNAAYLYAINCGPSDVRVDLPLDVGVPTFAPVSIPSIDVRGDSCTVGLFADMNPGDWLNADAFVFDELPAP